MSRGDSASDTDILRATECRVMGQLVPRGSKPLAPDIDPAVLTAPLDYALVSHDPSLVTLGVWPRSGVDIPGLTRHHPSSSSSGHSARFLRAANRRVLFEAYRATRGFLTLLELLRVKEPTRILYSERVYVFLKFVEARRLPFDSASDVDSALCEYFSECFARWWMRGVRLW